MSGLLSYETLVHAISGAAGGLTAMSVFYPLDTVRNRLQVEDHRSSQNTFLVMKDLVDDEGLQGLYRGIQPVLGSLACSNFVYFYTFHGLRSLNVGEEVGRRTVRDLLMAATAGIINVVVTTPLWVANSRIKMQGAKLSKEDSRELKKYPEYHGLMDAVYRIYKYEGVAALWRSLIPSLVLVVNPTIQFTVYEYLKFRVLSHYSVKELSAITYFLLGAVSKCVSTVLTYPLQLVQSKQRFGSEKLNKMNTLQLLWCIYKKQSFKGLYKGLEAKLLQTVLTAALMFLCYEKIAAFVFHILLRKSKVG